MKYRSCKKILLAVLLGSISLTALAQDARLTTHLQRATAHAQKQAKFSVLVTAVLQKPVKMSDVMCRPTRGCKNQVISYKQKTNICRGTLSQGGKRVYVPADCVAHADYTLSSVSLRFANGKVSKGSGRAVTVQEELAYILVKEEVTRGLRALAFAEKPH